MEKYFLNTFGYLEIQIDKKNIVEEFEKDITTFKRLEYIGNELAYEGEKSRKANLRNSQFSNSEIFKIFYNNTILNVLKSTINDFIILSPLESFYLSMSNIHRDFAGELKVFKLIFYLDDVSDQSKGPLYIIPGTQNIYDKYSTSVGMNVGWPPDNMNKKGAGFLEYLDYLNKNCPKKYCLSNQDKVIIFNNSLLHGSEGNISNPKLLRRAIAMTILCVDRNNKDLMNYTNKYLLEYNIKPKHSESYLYCKDNCSEWLEHFYEAPEEEVYEKLNQSEDGTDTNFLQFGIQQNLFLHYTDNIDKNYDEIKNETTYNCYKEQIKNYAI
jgi:hypothetical protein